MDGGVSTNDFVMQLTADLFGRKLSRLQHHEMSCLGAAFVAGLGVGRCTQAHTRHLYFSVPTHTMIFTVNGGNFMLVKTNLSAKDHCSCFEIMYSFLNTKPQLGGGISCIFTEVLQCEDEMKSAQALHFPCFLFSSKIRHN